MTNEELIAALEAADGPCRKLDAKVAVAFFGIEPDMTKLVLHENGKDTPCYYKHPVTGRIVGMPHAADMPFTVVRNDISEWGYTTGAVGWNAFAIPPFTSDIDAALMLVPEGCAVDLSIDDDIFSEVALITAHGPICATGATPAQAIVIAAIKARGEG